ncbi:MAG: hypothetical protein RhofKO_21000 [Rhodothermales bacterium]
MRGIEEVNAGWYATADVGALQAALDQQVEQGALVATQQPGGCIYTSGEPNDAHEVTEALVAQSYIDPLTRLSNRLLFTDRLQTALVLGHRDTSYTYAILFIDLDRFKQVNDQSGHALGDLILAEVGRRLRECTRATDTVARLGGDEFGVLLEYLDRGATARQVAQRILTRLRQPYHLLDEAVSLSASIGVVLADSGYERPQDVLHDADQAMFAAKQAGGDQYQVSLARMQRSIQLRIEDDLWHAIEREQLRVQYQPVIELHSGAVVAQEALVRWQHPEHGAVSPARFIPLAEESGFIHTLDLWVLQTSGRYWAQQGSVQKLLVNTSSRRFREPNMVTEIEDVLRRAGWSPAQLVLEITEHALMHDVIHTAEVLEALHALGIEIWIDDFGSGYSSLHLLHSLPVDALKIDRGFIQRLSEDPKAQAIVKAIIDMAHTLELRVVAEGIETDAQRLQLDALGCDMGQGFLLGRPA